MNKEEYHRITRPHERFLQQLLLDLKFHVEDLGQINVFTIQSRMKSFESALRKSQKKNTPIHELQDLAGLRVVVGTRPETDLIARFLYRMQDSNLRIVGDENISKEDGYGARHLIVKSEGSYSRSMFDAWVEIQLRTALQHAFDSISRAWSYKSDRPYSSEWKAAFVAVSENLKNIDGRIASLQDEVVRLAADMGDHDALSPLSLQSIIRAAFQETVGVDEAVDECRFLRDIGIDTNGKLKSLFGNEEIRQFRKELESIGNTDDGFVRSMLKCPQHVFWSYHGTRMEGIREMILERTRGMK